jgi:tetratricopeptide (TPR) repeat protein
LTDGTSRIATEAGSLEFDVQVAVEAPVGEAVSPNAENEATSTPQRAGDTSADTLREEIESLLGQLSTLDHYSALGLDESAGAAQFKRAYFKAAKKYHPDSLARLGLEDLREPAALIFGRIAEAFETLSDPEKKAAYDTYGSQEPEIDTARLAQAETSFRKGEILAKMGNFDGALEYFEPAVDLWPEEPAYQAELGWALYKQPNADLERATLHLEIAMNQAPEEALIRFRLGLIMRALGETNRANELISKAREIDPSVEG